MLAQELPHGMDLLLLAFSVALSHYRRASGRLRACQVTQASHPLEQRTVAASAAVVVGKGISRTWCRHVRVQ